MDFLRIIIEGGWVVTDTLEWIHILDFIEIMPELEQNRQVKDFFKHVAKVFDFEEDFKNNFLIFDDEEEVDEEEQ